MGLLLGLPGGAGEDSLSIDTSLPKNGYHAGYHLVQGYTRFFSKPRIDPGNAFEKATDEQVRILSGLTSLITPYCKLEPVVFESGATEESASHLGEQLLAFQSVERSGLPRLEPTAEVLDEHKEQLQQLTADQNAVAKFVKRFGNDSCGGSVKLTLENQSDTGQLVRSYEIRTGIPAESSGTEVFVATLRFDNEGTVDYAEHFDVNFEKLLQQKLQDRSFSGPELAALVREARENRRESQEAYAEERAEGFHEFSQADASRIIRALEATR